MTYLQRAMNGEVEEEQLHDLLQLQWDMHGLKGEVEEEG